MPEGAGLHDVFDTAVEIVSHLHPDLRRSLDRFGYFNIEGSPLLEELKRDEEFIQAQANLGRPLT